MLSQKFIAKHSLFTPLTTACAVSSDRRRRRRHHTYEMKRLLSLLSIVPLVSGYVPAHMELPPSWSDVSTAKVRCKSGFYFHFVHFCFNASESCVRRARHTQVVRDARARASCAMRSRRARPTRFARVRARHARPAHVARVARYARVSRAHRARRAGIGCDAMRVAPLLYPLTPWGLVCGSCDFLPYPALDDPSKS